MGYSKSSSKRDVYSNIILPRETRNIRNKQFNLTPRAARERRTNIFNFFFNIFNIFYLYLIFVSLINMCLSVFLLRFIVYGTLSASWTWLTISFPILGKFLTIISSNIFSSPFSFFSFFWYHYNSNVGAFYVVPESLRLSSFLFIHFSLFCSMAEISYHSVFQVTYPFFCLRYSAIGSFQYVFHFSYYSSLFVL